MRGYPCDCYECADNDLGTCDAPKGTACDDDEPQPEELEDNDDGK